MEYLRRLEYERKMEKLYKRKSSFHGFALAEHSHRVKRTAAFEASTLKTKMGLIRKEEQSSKHYRKKNLTAVESLENSITGPVSCTIPGTSREEILAARRDRSAANAMRRGAQPPPAAAAGTGQAPERASAAGDPTGRDSATSDATQRRSAGGKRVTIQEKPKKPIYKQPNRQPRSRTELANSLKYEPPSSAGKQKNKYAHVGTF